VGAPLATIPFGAFLHPPFGSSLLVTGFLERKPHPELQGPWIANRGHGVERRSGFDGYEPDPNVVLRVIGFTRSVRLNASTSPSTRRPPESRNERLTRRLTVKKSLPLPAFRGMNRPAERRNSASISIHLRMAVLRLFAGY
jgi:hypothetical protein